jgi:hypothetical protein
MSKSTKPTASAGPICVDIREAKPNKMFTEGQRAWVRFLVYNRAIPCAQCGKKRRIMWTMLCEFQCAVMEIFTAGLSDRRHMPLTPVCGDHPIGPATDKPQKEAEGT